MNNPCLTPQGILKIGLSKDPRARQKGLSRSVPKDYQLLRTYRVADMIKAETMVFDKLSQFKYSKEFYICPFELAERVCEQVTQKINEPKEKLTRNISITDEELDNLNSRWNMSFEDEEVFLD